MGSVKYRAITDNPDRVYFKRSANDLSDPEFKGHGRTPITLQKRNSNFFDKVQGVSENMPFQKPKLPSGKKIENLSARSVKAAEKQSEISNQNSRTFLKKIQNKNLPAVNLLGKRSSFSLDVKTPDEKKARRRSSSNRI